MPDCEESYSPKCVLYVRNGEPILRALWRIYHKEGTRYADEFDSERGKPN